MKKTIKIFIIILVISLIIIFFFHKFSSEKKTFSYRKCNYELSNVEEDRSSGGFYYKGLIKNNSDETETLKEVIAELYNEKNIYLGTGYARIERNIEPGVFIPFRMRIWIADGANEYFHESNILKPNIYAWFTTCK